MSSDTDIAALLLLIFRVVSILGSLSLFALGTVIVCIKEKLVKLLGLPMIFSGIYSLIWGSYKLAALLGQAGEDQLGALGSASSYISVAINILTLVCTCTFLKKRYGSNLFLPCGLIFLGQLIIPLLIANGLFQAKIIETPNEHIYFVSFLQTLFAIAGEIIIILAFLRNREKEKLIPYTGTIKIISTSLTIIYAAYFITNSLYIRTNGTDWPHLQGVYYVLELISQLTPLILPIYIVSRPGRTQET